MAAFVVSRQKYNKVGRKEGSKQGRTKGKRDLVAGRVFENFRGRFSHLCAVKIDRSVGNKRTKRESRVPNNHQETKQQQRVSLCVCVCVCECCVSVVCVCLCFVCVCVLSV